MLILIIILGDIRCTARMPYTEPCADDFTSRLSVSSAPHKYITNFFNVVNLWNFKMIGEHIGKKWVLKKFYWSWWTDLNLRPADYKSATLPIELHQRNRILLLYRFLWGQKRKHIKKRKTMAPSVGLEPTTSWLTVMCSTIELWGNI